MTVAVKNLTREELYELVWTTPMSRLAREFGFSDVGLAKVCKRFDVPRPARGHWAKLQHGQRLERLPLPAWAGSEPAAIELSAHIERRSAHQEAEQVEVGAEACSERPRIVVSEKLTCPHPLVEIARKQLRAEKPDSNRMVSTDPHTAPPIQIGAKSIGRALRLLDALLRGWESLGGAVELGICSFDQRRVLFLKMGEEAVQLKMLEKTEWAPESSGRDRPLFSRYPPKRPTGDLVFATERNCWVKIRSTRSDGKRHRLEEVLDQVVHGLLIHIETKKQQTLDEHCEDRQKKKVQWLRDAAKRDADEEKTRRELLEKNVMRWNKARRIREYLVSVRDGIRLGTLNIVDEPACKDWFEWAHWYVDDLDPLVRVNPRSKPKTEPQNISLAEMDLTSRAKPVLEALGVKDTNGLCGVTEEQLKERSSLSHLIWYEVCRVLEGQGYDMSTRSYYL